MRTACFSSCQRQGHEQRAEHPHYIILRIEQEEVEKMKKDAQAHGAEDAKKKRKDRIKNQADNLVFSPKAGEGAWRQNGCRDEIET